MKRINKTLSLIFLSFLGTAGFTACSSSDDASEQPSDQPRETVKTSFTLSVALPQNRGGNAKFATRVSDEVAQVNNTFRGIQDINLIPFGLAGRTNEDNPVESNSTRLGSNVTLNNFESSESGTDKSKVYNDVSLPQGTSAFLFYGRAIDNDPTTDEGYHQNGALTESSKSGAPSTITFTPKQIFTQTETPEKAQSLADYLTQIANTKLSDGTTWGTQNSDENPLYELYQQFIKIENGSSDNVQIAVQQIYKSLTTDNSTSDMATAILESIKKGATVDETNKTITLNDNLKGYPTDLPDGVCLVKWNTEDNKFDVNLNGSTNSGDLATKPSDLVYPANLQYFANTNIKTSNTDLSGQYTTGATWSTILGQYSDGSQVSSSTRSVALSKQIHYAVGRLDVKVTKAAATLKDKKGEEISADFPISAIFVSNQGQVGFDFTPVPNSPEYTIYDNQVPSDWTASATGSTVARTLALETPSSTDDNKVNIAVEFTNNSGKDFNGKDGIIYNGAKFYLIASLDPSATTSVNKPEGSTSLNQVIKQDYTTTANLTISADGSNSGLGNAYNVLPDLRNPKLTLGMSVDLNWQTGLTFNVDM